jgi:parallel beta-helix repeat protein
LENCRFTGFEFTVQCWEGAQGEVTDCVLSNSGHCGITAGRDSQLEVKRNIVFGSDFHGIRCTGGRIHVEDNLVLRNKNRGIYLGNRTARGYVRNNLLLGNATGISAFAQTEVEITRNVILQCDYAGLGTRGSCRIRVADNIIGQSTRGIVSFAEGGPHRFAIGRNVFWQNQTDAENFELPADALLIDPRFNDAEQGDFSAGATEVRDAGQGLTRPEVIQRLWLKFLKEQEAAGETAPKA